jgi:hypothetical protein
MFPPPHRRVDFECERISPVMSAWLAVLVPLLVMFFALGMERVESRLRGAAVRPDELEELL